ncbi:hypothetical protein QOZ80_6BG0484380 [Eleusine coracana subsp. coracana]|nr:hypothetical protein QOZ80_6BG0484380 [Eleusine coracana subsp. coracana]
MYAVPAKGRPAFRYPHATMAPAFYQAAGSVAQPPFNYANKAAPMMMAPFYNTAAAAAAMPPPVTGVPVRQVWAHNLDAEMDAVLAFATRARHVSFSVQYPGVVHGGADQQQDPAALTTEKRYAFLKANVDALKPLQVGLAILADDGRCAAWEFNLAGFDPSTDPHAPRSVAHLAARGMDLAAHRAVGVPVHRFSMALHHCALLRRPGIAWVTHAGAYHVAYFLKIITGGQPMPADITGFLALARRFLCGDVFDVARVAGDRPGLPVGLERIAAVLGLAAPLGSPRLAGARAVLAMQVFVTLGPGFYRGFAPLI